MLTYIFLFLSVAAGAVIVEILKPKKTKNIQLLLTFSGSYLLAITILHLIPELFNQNLVGIPYGISIYILIGFILQILLEYFSQGIEHGHLHKTNIIPFSVLISLCFHAILESVPLGVEHAHHETQNVLLTGIVLHKIPVAVVLMTLFLESGMKKKQAYLLLLIFSIMSPLGVYFGNMLSEFSYQLRAIVIGIFLHISTTILFESTDGHKFSSQKIIMIVIASTLAILSL